MKTTKLKRHRFPTEVQDYLSVYCFKLRTEQNLTLEHIGEIIDRNHSTVIYHLKRYKALSSFDKKFKETSENFNEEEFKQKLLKYGIEPYHNLTIN